MNHPSRPPLAADDVTQSDPARLSLLGHDLRAAVSDVIGGLRLIDQGALDDETRLQLERVRAAGEGLARLLEESMAMMLGESDLRLASPANVQMSRFLYDTEVRWSGRAREKGLAFAMTVGEDVPSVLALDRIALERILANTLSNAVKYTDVGTVALNVSLTETGALRFLVRDDGPGFAPEALARLYEYMGRPDGTGKPGTGLGMHISKDMAGRLGATMSVTNRTGGGADVAVELPRDVWSAAEPEVRTELPDLSRVKILLAEDNLTNQTIIGNMLSAMGAEFEVAEDGVEALHWLEREEFDLALIDIEMPRLSGIDVMREVRRNHRSHMPIIAVTAYVLRGNRDAIYAAGADAILAKPICGIETFGTVIANALGRAGNDVPLPERTRDEKADLNHERFDALLAIAGDDGARELLARLHEDLRRAERGLVVGLKDTDLAAIRAETHVLIALAGAVGAEQLQALVEAMNAAAHRRDSAGMQVQGDLVLAQLDRLIHFIAQEQARRSEVR